MEDDKLNQKRGSWEEIASGSAEVCSAREGRDLVLTVMGRAAMVLNGGEQASSRYCKLSAAENGKHYGACWDFRGNLSLIRASEIANECAKWLGDLSQGESIVINLVAVSYSG